MSEFAKEMVERVEWMSPIDYEIMLFFDKNDILASPKVISANIGYDRVYTNRRVRKLSEAELLQSEGDRGLYELTEKGRAYLRGDLDAEDLEEPENE